MRIKQRIKYFRNPRAPALPEILWNAEANQSDSEALSADVLVTDLPVVPFDPNDSATTLSDRAQFDAFSARDDVPGALGVREVKFVIVGVDTNTPQLYFMSSVRQPLHFYFVRDHLGIDLTIEEFNRVTYFTDQRRFVAGTIVAYDNYKQPDGSPGLYALEFWPTDPVGIHYVAKTYHMIRSAMSFAAETLAYHPSSDLQEQLFVREADAYATQFVRTASTYEIFEDITYNPLNLGEAIGTLRLITGTESRPPSATDIVIYETLPNDLPIVAGVISSAPQTPLSHVNLRARQNGIANAYLRDAANDPQLKKFIGKTVRLIVKPEGIEVHQATTAEASAALAGRRPSIPQIPARDLGPRSIVALDDLAWTDVSAYGAKATNLAELRRTIDPVFVPNGFAIPFSFYDDFMIANGLYDMIISVVAELAFSDDDTRPSLLKAVRRAIKSAPLSETMRDQLDAMHKAFPTGTTPRCRSSANNEDLVGFTGAGLYDSYTHRADEGHIEKSIKQVWASLWNLRAYNEREFYRIDHLTAAMGVLVHPNFDDEQVNGVALTRNIYFPEFEGYFINAQVGENLITNPEDTETAEEVLVIKDLNLGNVRIYETIYIRRSSLVSADKTVISHPDLIALVTQMKVIQDHFQLLYERTNDDTFAMDIEFKFDRNGKLVIKQARPWAG